MLTLTREEAKKIGINDEQYNFMLAMEQEKEEKAKEAEKEKEALETVQNATEAKGEKKPETEIIPAQKQEMIVPPTQGQIFNHSYYDSWLKNEKKKISKQEPMRYPTEQERDDYYLVEAWNSTNKKSKIKKAGFITGIVLAAIGGGAAMTAVNNSRNRDRDNEYIDMNQYIPKQVNRPDDDEDEDEEE